MTRLVVDASVAVKWFVPEVHGEAAKRFLDPNHELLAPELIWAELGNALWKKRRRGEIDATAARRMFMDFKRYPLTTFPLANLAEAAWDIAERLDRSVYDSFYLALAEDQRSRLVTADRKFYDAATAHELMQNIVWVEDHL